MDFGTYCGTELVLYLSQVKWDQLNRDFVTLAELNNFIRGTLIPEAERMVDTYCHHAFGTPSYGTIVLDGNGKSWLPIPPEYCPLIGLSAGSVDGVGVTIANIMVYDDYVKYDGGNFTRNKQNVVFYGSFGYLNHQRVPIVPQDVAYVTAQIAANVLTDAVRRRMLPDIMQPALQGGGANVGALFSHPNVFPPSLQEKLDRYKISWIDVG